MKPRLISIVFAVAAGSIASVMTPVLAARPALAQAATAQTSTVQTWPARPLTMVAPFAAGGTTDAIARIVAEGLNGQLGQPVIVENTGGAGGMTGANRVAKATPDGYQFLLGSVSTHAQSQSLYKKPLYHAVTDFAPVGLLAEQPVVLVARKDLPADNLPEFISYTKANQAKMQFGSPGAGSSNHLACVLLNAAIGIDVTHVPYRGGAQAMQDLIGGRIDYQCPTGAVAIPQVVGRTVKALAILTKHRSPILPDLASAHEQGLANFDSQNWYAIFLPSGTPAPIIRKLHDAAVTTLETPSIQKRLKEIGAEPASPERRSSEYLAKFVVDEIERWARPIKESGVQF
jgi:tripartite-type tricarboxylate transporter receptor subunit TctC